MSSSSDNEDRNTFYSILCMLVIIVFAAVGGFLINLLGGYKFPKFMHRFGLVKFKPMFTSFKFPSLLGEIIFGIIARNAFTDFMEDYDPKWGEYARMICLTVLLLAGGMHLDFKGKGLIVLLLVLFSPCVEAFAIGGLATLCLDMTLPLGLSLGFTIAAVSPAVLVPPLLQLQFEGYGIANGIPTTLIAASSFEDVTVIIFYGIFSTIALNTIKEDEDSVGQVLFKICYELAAGVAAGALLGYLMRFIKKVSIKIKFIVSLCIAIGMVLTFELTGFHESKYLSIIIYGYMCRQSWGNERPDHYLNVIFSYITPFLFGTVGAAMVFSDIDTSVLGYAFLIIFVGVISRWASTILSTLQPKYSWGEKLFMACAWLPKATVQAALGGNILEKAKEEDNAEYINFGNKILTISILSILVTSPPCAISTLILGKKFLPQQKTLNENEEEGYLIPEKDETIINEVINQEIPGVELSESIKTGLQLSIAKSRMRRARMRNLIQSPNAPGVHYILATHQVNPADQINAIMEENEFGIDIQAEQQRPRIKSGEAQQQKLSTADNANSEAEVTTKQQSRRNSMVSLSHHGSQQSLSSIGFSVGDIQDQQLEQIHQINQKWKEQKIQHMQGGTDKKEESESYDTWERSFEDIQNKPVNESDADILREQNSQGSNNERKFLEHQISEMSDRQQEMEQESIPTESAQLNPLNNFQWNSYGKNE